MEGNDGQVSSLCPVYEYKQSSTDCCWKCSNGGIISLVVVG